MGLDDKRRREKERLLALVNRRPGEDAFPGQGVVLAEGIQFYCRQFDLICPLEPDNLKPANYKLRVGDQCAVGGEIKGLSDEPDRDAVVIPPFAVAVIKTFETLNMPQFLIARWNIQVQRAYDGLLWVGGPQVDAGFVGHLACPIYNLSSREVRLRYRDPFAVIDFVKTTKYVPGVSQDYKPLPPDRILFEDYHPEKLQSGLITLATSRLDKFAEDLEGLKGSTSERIKHLEDRFLTFGALGLTLIAILFAALAVLVTNNSANALSVWNYVAICFSVLALLLAAAKRRS
jgi:deoxycytidine triphosphate deaminase